MGDPNLRVPISVKTGTREVSGPHHRHVGRVALVSVHGDRRERGNAATDEHRVFGCRAGIAVWVEAISDLEGLCLQTAVVAPGCIRVDRGGDEIDRSIEAGAFE